VSPFAETDIRAASQNHEASLDALHLAMDSIEVAPSAIHGLGLFAGRSFAAGQLIIEYLGERISKNESIRRCSEGNQFIFYLNEESDLDGGTELNLARFANHHCSPNCVVKFIDGQLWLSAARAIASGEELTFDYGYDLSDCRDYACSCGAPNCPGYIVAEEFRSVGADGSSLTFPACVG